MGQDALTPGLEVSSLQGCVEDPTQLFLYPEKTRLILTGCLLTGDWHKIL